MAKQKPDLTAEARENRVISLAYDLAEKQIAEGTASSQVITHFLKMGSSTGRAENAILHEQKALVKAKTENLQSAKDMVELYNNAITAMRDYGGDSNDEDN